MREPHEADTDRARPRAGASWPRRIPSRVSAGSGGRPGPGPRAASAQTTTRSVVGLGASTAALAVVGAGVILPGTTGGDADLLPGAGGLRRALGRGPDLGPAAGSAAGGRCSRGPAERTTTADPVEIFAPTLAGWNEVLAEHLDPGRTHLRPWGGSTATCRRPAAPRRRQQALGSKYAWTEPGQDGRGCSRSRSRAAARTVDLALRDGAGGGRLSRRSRTAPGAASGRGRPLVGGSDRGAWPSGRTARRWC